MNELEQAEELLACIRGALTSFRRPSKELHMEETEVVFRYEAIQGVLLMAQNDVASMVREWTDQYAAEAG